MALRTFAVRLVLVSITVVGSGLGAGWKWGAGW
jgi:hypothetical protein